MQTQEQIQEHELVKFAPPFPGPAGQESSPGHHQPRSSASVPRTAWSAEVNVAGTGLVFFYYSPITPI